MNTIRDTMNWVQSTAAGVICCTATIGQSASNNTHPPMEDGRSACNDVFLRQEHLGQHLQRQTLHAVLLHQVEAVASVLIEGHT